MGPFLSAARQPPSTHLFAVNGLIYTTVWLGHRWGWPSGRPNRSSCSWTANNSTQQSNSWTPDSSSAGPELPRVLHNPLAHPCVPHDKPVVQITRQINALHSQTLHSWEAHFNINISSTSRSWKQSLPLEVFLLQTCTYL